MERLARFSRTSIGRATIGFTGTAAVLLATPLLAPEASAARPAPAYQAQRIG